MNLSSTWGIRSENPLPQAGKTPLRRLVGGSAGPQTPHADFWRLRLDGAELVIVRATHNGSVRRALEINDFPLTPARAGLR